MDPASVATGVVAALVASLPKTVEQKITVDGDNNTSVQAAGSSVYIGGR